MKPSSRHGRGGRGGGKDGALCSNRCKSQRHACYLTFPPDGHGKLRSRGNTYQYPSLAASRISLRDVAELRGLSHTHFPNEYTAIRNNPHQVALFKASARFAYRSSTNAQHLGERAFVNSISRLQFSPDDHSLQFFGDQGTEGFCAPAS